MIERRPFASLDGLENDWFKNKLHVACHPAGASDGQPNSALLLWNDDIVAPDSGFPSHLHTDVEILTYVLQGAISHRDSAGNSGRTTARNLRLMSAGSGIMHADFNAEPEPAHLFQIWLKPRGTGKAPRWEQRAVPRRNASGELVTLATGDRHEACRDALFVNSEARVLWAPMKAGETIVHPLYGAAAYLVPTAGEITLSGRLIAPRDGAAIIDERQLRICALADTEILMVELL